MLIHLSEVHPAGQRYVAVCRQGLKELGWTDGGNVRIDVRWTAGDLERLSLIPRRIGRAFYNLSSHDGRPGRLVAEYLVEKRPSVRHSSLSRLRPASAQRRATPALQQPGAGLISEIFPPPANWRYEAASRLASRRAALKIMLEPDRLTYSFPRKISRVWSRLLVAFASAAIFPHIPDKRLASLIHMHLLDTDNLRAAVPQTA